MPRENEVKELKLYVGECKKTFTMFLRSFLMNAVSTAKNQFERIRVFANVSLSHSYMSHLLKVDVPFSKQPHNCFPVKTKAYLIGQAIRFW